MEIQVFLAHIHTHDDKLSHIITNPQLPSDFIVVAILYSHSELPAGVSRSSSLIHLLQ